MQTHIWPQSAALLKRTAAWSVLIAIAILAGVALDRLVLVKTQPVAVGTDPQPEASHDLKLDTARIEGAGIRLLQVEPGRLSNQIAVQATVAATPEGAAVIGARADGTVTEIRKRLGDTVAKGQSLGAIQSREAARLAEDIASARAKLTMAQKDFDRQKSLLALSATSKQNFDIAEAALQTAQAQYARARAAGAASGLSRDGISLSILSPVAGRITSAPAVLGAYVVAGGELFRVANPLNLEVQAAVPSLDAQRVAVGDEGEIELPSGPVKARVRAITPDIDLQSRAATVVLIPEGDAPGLQPGQLVSVHIKVAHGHSDIGAIVVPSDAIQKIGGSSVVFIRTEAGFRAQEITAGSENTGMTEIIAGLKPGDRVAASNAFLLKAEMRKGSGDHD